MKPFQSTAARRPFAWVAGLVALSLTGAIAPAAAADAKQPQVVVAVPDTGVNPYHKTYYRPENTAHPCTWVEGFDDCSIPALNLSVGTAKSYEQALALDANVWASVKPDQWYWIPKTNIIGAVCDSDVPVPSSTVCILDDDSATNLDAGHGTATTSSVLSEAPDALLLVHDGNSSAADLATAPVVPDIESYSWGTPAPLPLHAVDPVVPGDSIGCGDKAFEEATILFMAAGNEAPLPAMADCWHVNNRVQIVGGAWPGYWNTSSYSTFDFASWYCRPAASHTSPTEFDEHCGTSFSAPTVAGAAAAALLEIRRAEGYTGRSTATMVSTTVSRDEFIQALRSAATYAPEAKFPNRPEGVRGARAAPLPAQAPYLFWGYGWADSTVSDEVVTCALAGQCPAKSAEAESWNAFRRQFRSTTYDDAVPASAQDDAGSGRDAGITRPSAVPITAGRKYTAHLQPAAGTGDDEDWFTFDATAGQAITVAMDGPFAGWELVDPRGEVIALGQVDGLLGEPSDSETVTASVSGQYVLTYMDPYVAQDYEFTVTIG
jgi:hypothetical protein